MDITPTALAATTSAVTATATPDAVISSDFETFLKMLTAQARYQDPLEPIDSSEYAAQLAQFSMVEQQVLSNDLLTSLASQFGGGNISQMAGVIGMEARTTAPIPFDGSPITITPNPAGAADSATLIVRDAAGNTVQQLPMPVSAEPLQWAGVTDQGRPFANSLYSFEVESVRDGEVILSEPAETYARVTEARILDGETVLILDGGSSVLASSVSGLRDPSSST